MEAKIISVEISREDYEVLLKLAEDMGESLDEAAKDVMAFGIERSDKLSQSIHRQVNRIVEGRERA